VPHILLSCLLLACVGLCVCGGITQESRVLSCLLFAGVCAGRITH